MSMVCSIAFAVAQSPDPSRTPQLRLAPDLFPRPAQRRRFVTLAKARPRFQLPAILFPLREPAREAVKRSFLKPDLPREQFLQSTAGWRKQWSRAAYSSLGQTRPHCEPFA